MVWENKWEKKRKGMLMEMHKKRKKRNFVRHVTFVSQFNELKRF
jgi:hypothetical protein